MPSDIHNTALSNDRERKRNIVVSICLEILQWIPVIFITAIIIWSYYAYVFELCLFTIDNYVELVTFLVFYHFIGILFCWSYWSTIFTPVGKVPLNWRLPDTEIERLYRAESQDQQRYILESFAKEFPISNRTLNGSIRYCDKCKVIKPDRAHHCSVCKACVLKMDHHCPWINNCVNFSNYKFFVLFLGYAVLYCIYVALTTVQYFILFWKGEMGRFHLLFLFFVSLMFALSLISLFGYHIYLTLMNRTTLEAFRAPIFRIGGPDKNGFNLGKSANFKEVFGDNWKLWFLPIYTSLDDGVQFKLAIQVQRRERQHLQHLELTGAAYNTINEMTNSLKICQPFEESINKSDTPSIIIPDKSFTINQSPSPTSLCQVVVTPTVLTECGHTVSESSLNGSVTIDMHAISDNILSNQTNAKRFPYPFTNLVHSS